MELLDQVGTERVRNGRRILPRLCRYRRSRGPGGRLWRVNVQVSIQHCDRV